MTIIHAEVDDDVEEYLREWADAVGCEVHEVAGDAIRQYLESGEYLAEGTDTP